MNLQLRPLRAGLLLCLPAPAFAQLNPTVIFTEIPGAPTSTVPGALDAGGLPVFTEFVALEDLAVRPDGGDWIMKGRTTQATTLDSILIRGGVAAPTMFCQDGQPLQGGVAGEQYDFFDSPFPAAWDSAGNIAFSCRAKGGVATVFEKVVFFNGATHTIVAQMGDAIIGITDEPPALSGDELLGNSINSVHLLDSGDAAFSVTPITACSSFRYPALIHGHTAFRYCRGTSIGGENWDGFISAGFGGTPDGLHWYAEGDTENVNTAIDAILAVDDVVVLREGSPVVPAGPVMSDIFATRMAWNGDWYARGDDPAANDWAVRNGVLLAKTGDAITGGENWGATFGAFNGNTAGHWVLYGNTTNIDPNADNVLVLDGTTILLREGQPIDVNGNGLFDDNAFLASVQPNDLFLTDTDVVFALVTLRNAALTSLGDGMLRFDVGNKGVPFCSGDGSLIDHSTPCPCGNNGAPGNGCAHSFDPNGANLTSTGNTTYDDIVLDSTFTPSNSFTLFMQHDAGGDTVFHDGVLCAGGTLIRLRGRNAVAGQALFPNPMWDSSITLSQRGSVTIGSGAVRYYAAWYRNASTTFCPPATANVTNGLQIIW